MTLSARRSQWGEVERLSCSPWAHPARFARALSPCERGDYCFGERRSTRWLRDRVEFELAVVR